MATQLCDPATIPDTIIASTIQKDQHWTVFNNPKPFAFKPTHIGNMLPKTTGSEAAVLYTAWNATGSLPATHNPTDTQDSGRRCEVLASEIVGVKFVYYPVNPNPACMCPRLQSNGEWIAPEVQGTTQADCDSDSSACKWPSDILKQVDDVEQLLETADTVQLPALFVSNFIMNYANRIWRDGGLESAQDRDALFTIIQKQIAKGTDDKDIAAALQQLLSASCPTDFSQTTVGGPCVDDTGGGDTPSKPAADPSGGDTPSKPAADISGGDTPSKPAADISGGGTHAPVSGDTNDFDVGAFLHHYWLFIVLALVTTLLISLFVVLRSKRIHSLGPPPTDLRSPF